jgi:hypothetical protein
MTRPVTPSRPGVHPSIAVSLAAASLLAVMPAAWNAGAQAKKGGKKAAAAPAMKFFLPVQLPDLVGPEKLDAGIRVWVTQDAVGVDYVTKETMAIPEWIVIPSSDKKVVALDAGFVRPEDQAEGAGFAIPELESALKKLLEVDKQLPGTAAAQGQTAALFIDGAVPFRTGLLVMLTAWKAGCTTILAAVGSEKGVKAFSLKPQPGPTSATSIFMLGGYLRADMEVRWLPGALGVWAGARPAGSAGQTFVDDSTGQMGGSTGHSSKLLPDPVQLVPKGGTCPAVTTKEGKLDLAPLKTIAKDVCKANGEPYAVTFAPHLDCTSWNELMEVVAASLPPKKCRGPLFVKTGAGGWKKGECKDWKMSGSDPMACTTTVEAAKAVKHLKAAYLALYESKVAKPSPTGEPPKPVIQVGNPTVGGGLEAGTVKKKLLMRMAAFKSCYAKALEKNPALAGKITITFTVSPEGYAGGIEVETAYFSDAKLLSCIKAKIMSIKFEPPSDGKPAKVDAFLLLKPKEN